MRYGARNMTYRLQEKFKKEVVSAMMEKFGLNNKMAVPKIEKVIINSSFAKGVSEKTSKEREKIQKIILEDLALISGQKPKLIKAKKSISGFKLRKGMEIAAIVTLRGSRMYDFLERLIYLALPRSRDFKGIDTKSIDEKGNLTIGFREHIVFPEIFTEKEKTIFGLEVTVVVSTNSKEEGLELYKLLGFPMKN